MYTSAISILFKFKVSNKTVTVFTYQIKVERGWGNLFLKISGIKLVTSAYFPTVKEPIASW